MQITGIEAGPFRQNGIQGKPATPPSARPPSHSTSTSTARAGGFETLHLRHKMVLGLSVLAIAGLALLPTIGRGLQSAVANEVERDPALVTFLVTASGLTLWGIGPAFWGVLFGVAALIAWRPRAA
jgi:hypothetical protein